MTEHLPSALAGSIDVCEVVLIIFLGFVFTVFFYLHREDKREGYPLIDPAGGRNLIGFPRPPPPKTYNLMDGGTSTTPQPEGRTNLALARSRFPGAPFEPTGDPMLDGVGPASWALKRDEPLLLWNGDFQLQPLRRLPEWGIQPGDPDLRGMLVLDADGKPVGIVADLWLDHGPKILRYLEIALSVPGGPPRAMVPIYFVETYPRLSQVRVPSLFARHFATFPQLQAADTITAREEDRVASYCQGGVMYGDARRAQPLL